MKFYGVKDDITKNEFGGKAFGLKWLYEHNFPIPESFFIKANSNFGKDDFILAAENIFLKGSFVAVRSSALDEDGEEKSNAGCYETFLNVDSSPENIFDAYQKVLESANGKPMGVVVQRCVQPIIAGVLFTSNPTTLSKKEMVINFAEGFSDKLVSGESSGQEIFVNKDSLELSDSENKIYFEELIRMAIKIEIAAGYPCDIEWCVEKQTGKIFIVQCRPITNAFHKSNNIRFIKQENFLHDKTGLDFDKVSMRLNAEAENIFVSPAYLVQCNCKEKEFPLNKNDLKIERSKYCCGYNVVLLFPKKLDGKILRSFTGKKEDAKKYISCNRYTIRAFPEHEGVYETLRDIYEKVFAHTWKCTMIIQEIFDPVYTGIASISENQNIIEVARGHFVAKGVVPMSTYSVDADGNITAQSEIEQSKYMRLLEGCRVEHNTEPKLVHLEKDVITDIIKTFKSLGQKSNLNLEFGLLEDEAALIPYLIDYTEEENPTVSADDINDGVISHGRIEGKLVKVEPYNFEDSVNAHFYDEQSDSSDDENAVIYLCDLPDIKLAEKIKQKNVGFAFKSGAMLCHLAVLLRENGIPAITGVDFNMLEIGEEYVLDTSLSGDWEKKLCKRI